MTGFESLRTRLVLIRSTGLAIQSLSSDAAAEAAALVRATTEALSDLASLERAAQRDPAPERLAEAGLAGLLVDGPGPGDEIH